MPILSDPDQTFAVVLERDKDMPEATRPAFYAKACSARQQREMYKLLDKFDEVVAAGVIDDTFDEAFRQLADRLVGWKNISLNGQPCPFDLEKLEDVITLEESIEILGLIRSNQYVQEGEKKSSES